MAISHISGVIMVKVEHVDIEQICIEKPKAVAGFPLNLKAMVAALDKPDIQSFQRQIEKSNHCLQWEAPHYGIEDILVVFKVMAKKADSSHEG